LIDYADGKRSAFSTRFTQMTEELIRPIDAETAKAMSDAAQLGSKIVDVGAGVGRYAAGVLGNLRPNLVGIASDYVAYKRLNRAVELEHDYKKLLADRGVSEPIEPSPSIAVPLLEAAVDEDLERFMDQASRQRLQLPTVVAAER
jgi:hypothetical protein